jgi:hypothetical protein
MRGILYNMLEDIKLLGTHQKTLKTTTSLNVNYRGNLTYDQVNKKYYVIMLAN